MGISVHIWILYDRVYRIKLCGKAVITYSYRNLSSLS